MPSMASKSVEVRPPGRQSGMEQSNHSIFPEEELSLIPAFDRKFVPGTMLYLTVTLSKARQLCSPIRLFLSNSSSVRFLRVSTSCVWIFPEGVVKYRVALIVFVMTFGGKAVHFINKTMEPQSSSTLRSLQLLTMFIVSEVHIVTSD